MFAGLLEGKTGANESNTKLFSQTVSASKKRLVSLCVFGYKIKYLGTIPRIARGISAANDIL
jgi:hypothetical protein